MSSQTAPKRRRRPGRPALGPDALSQARAEEIAVTLRDGTFRNGVTLRAFAAKWNLTEHRVYELSGLASKKVRAEVTDPDRVAAKGFAMLESIADEARHGADAKGNTAGHLAVAVKAVDTWLTKSGIAAPTKSAVHVTGDLSQLTDEQLEAREREVLARIAARSSK